MFRPPVITGRTTINEGGTLDLVCDASSTIRYATVKWFSPEGAVVSNEVNIVIMNIQRNAAGIYTCEATHTIHETTMSTTVNVIVQLARPRGVGLVNQQQHSKRCNNYYLNS